MIQGVAEGYVDIKNKHEVEFQSPEAAKLFIDLCSGVDEYRQESYRYGYQPKITKKKTVVTVIDIGE